jgi:predicted nucleic acid-binding protein
MGVVVDSSVVIALERSGSTAVDVLTRIAEVAGDQRAVLSTIGLTELVHGIHRSATKEMFARRMAFLNDLLLDLEVVSYSKQTAFLAGRIDSEQRARGFTIPFADLLIGATALEVDYAVLTGNLRHFNLIPCLQVIPFALSR